LLEIMKRFFNILLLTSLIITCSKITFGQLVSDVYCKEFENIVATPLSPAHWYHNIVFEDECWLEFAIDKKDGIGVSFKLEKAKTHKLAKKSLKSDIEMYESQHFFDRGKEMKFSKYEKNGFWDEAYFYDSYGPMLLLKKNVFITIFCDDRKLCPQIETRLRSISILE
jgi:hypothetical protein